MCILRVYVCVNMSCLSVCIQTSHLVKVHKDKLTVTYNGKANHNHDVGAVQVTNFTHTLHTLHTTTLVLFRSHTYKHTHTHSHSASNACVVCVCVSEREKDGDRERAREREIPRINM
jgi:hypothetical protein